MPNPVSKEEVARGATIQWCHGQAQEIMAITAGCATTHGDPGGGLEMANRLASDIAANLEMIFGLTLSGVEELVEALADALIMIGRLKKHCQITDGAGYTPDGRMLRLQDVEQAANAALTRFRGDGK